ncbi:MAG: saccharopine dehydrogenase family protein [Candidatus Promineifilaceae bacterium]
MAKWLLYGAYGYTGQLIVEEALRREQLPLLAGRDEAKLRPLAEKHQLDYRVVDLADTIALNAAVAEVDLVLHAAGPFSQTSLPMVRACLAGGCHYLDITGEIAVFEQIFTLDQQALERGIALIPGVGFDVVPTDCLALYVAQQLPAARELEIGIGVADAVSAGTAKTVIEGMASTGYVRRNGELTAFPLGKGGKDIRFSDGQVRYAVPSPFGDLATAWRSTGIPNITVFKDYSPSMVRFMGLSAALSRPLMAWSAAQRLAQRIAGRLVKGPDADFRRRARSYLWAWVSDGQGQAAEAWLETMETYRFTAVAAVRAVEQVLTGNSAGALTPAQAFGPDFVLELGETQRFDRL